MLLIPVRTFCAYFQAPIHGCFFIDGDTDIIYQHLMGCVASAIDVPTSTILRILHGSSLEIDVVLDSATEKVTPYIRFYAAAPIVVAGTIIGGFFKMDHEPHSSVPLFKKTIMLNLADAVSKVNYSNYVCNQ